VNHFAPSVRPFAATRTFLSAAAILFSSLFAPSVAHATGVALSADTFVSSSRSTTNFGTVANLYIGNGNTALLQFDLSSLPTGTTSSQIAKASLIVFVNRINVDGTVNLSPVTSAWTELGVTYATIPGIGAATTSFNATTAGVYVTLDVTALDYWQPGIGLQRE